MTTTKKILLVLLAVCLIAPVSQISRAQADDCNPLPTDPQAILNCNFNNLLSPVTKTYAPGQDPGNPTAVPLSGIRGQAGAYADSTQDLLVVATSADASGGGIGLYAVTMDPTTFTVKTQPVKINEGARSDASNPAVVYSPDLDKFLVAWEDGRNGDNTRQTYGRFLGPDGSLLGDDFRIMPTAAFLNDLDYDAKNQNFVLLFETEGKGNYIRTVSGDGTVSDALSVPRLISSAYEGQSNVAINTNLDQYWVEMLGCLNPDGATTEDCKVGVYRYDIAAQKWLGDPTILSQPDIGHNHFGGADIAYSPQDGAALVVWLQTARPEGQGQWGRTMYDDGSLSAEHEILTPATFLFSSAFGAPALNYNHWTNTVFDSTQDWEGGSILLEALTNGLVLNVHQAIAPPQASFIPSWRQLASVFVPQANAAAYGTFWSVNAVYPQGAVSLGSQNYSSVVMTSTTSILAPIQPAGSSTPAALAPPAGGGITVPVQADTSTLPKLINQIYLWALGVGALLALLMTVLGGYFYMTSGGNAESASRGKDMIFSAIVGLVLLFGSYLILRTINPDLVEFKIPAGTCIKNVPGAATDTQPDANTQAACEAAGGLWYSYTQ
jgi:hypothetical protein